MPQILLSIFILLLPMLGFSQEDWKVKQDGDKYGFWDEERQQFMLTQRFDRIDVSFKDGYAVVAKKNETEEGRNYWYGIVDTKGEMKLPYANQHVTHQGLGVVCIFTNGGAKILNINNGKTISDDERINCQVYKNLGEVKVFSRTRQGIYDLEGNVKIEMLGRSLQRMRRASIPRRDTVNWLPYYLLTYDVQNKVTGRYDEYQKVLDLKGKTVVVGGHEMDRIRMNHRNTIYFNRTAIYSESGAAVVNGEMKEVIPFKAGYEDLRMISDSTLVQAIKDGKTGLINLKGEEVLPFVFEDCSINLYKEGIYSVRKYTQSWGSAYVNGKGEYLLPPGYMVETDQLVIDFNEPLVVKNREYYMGVYLPGKGEIIPVNYSYVSAINQNRVVVTFSDSAGIMNLKGKTYFKLKCNDLTDFHEDVAIVGHKGKLSNNFFYRYVDSIGKPLHKGVYKQAKPFINGVAEVTKEKDPFMINKKGERIYFQDSTFLVSYYDSGYAFISNKLGQLGLVDEFGNIVTMPSVVKIKKKWMKLPGAPNDIYRRDRYGRSTEMCVPKIENGHFYEKKFHTWVEADLPK